MPDQGVWQCLKGGEEEVEEVKEVKEVKEEEGEVAEVVGG